MTSPTLAVLGAQTPLGAALVERWLKTGALHVVPLSRDPATWVSALRASKAETLCVLGDSDQALPVLKSLSPLREAGIARCILLSSTALYGAKPIHPALLTEATPLLTMGASPWTDRHLKLEQLGDALSGTFSVAHLRLAPILALGLKSPWSLYFALPFIVRLMGFDPLWQVLHLDDAARAVAAALASDANGAFNIVGRGVSPLSHLIRAAGKVGLPLPPTLAEGALGLTGGQGPVGLRSTLLPALRYGCVADGRRAEALLGFAPHWHVVDTAANMGSNRDGTRENHEHPTRLAMGLARRAAAVFRH
ncbi:MAG: UDP-glucose 4-epimerase [Myxococcaceae bacterium]